MRNRRKGDAPTETAARRPRVESPSTRLHRQPPLSLMTPSRTLSEHSEACQGNQAARFHPEAAASEGFDAVRARVDPVEFARLRSSRLRRAKPSTCVTFFRSPEA